MQESHSQPSFTTYTMKSTLELFFTNTFGGCVMVHGQTPDLEPIVGRDGPSSTIIAYVEFRRNPEGEFEWANDINKITNYVLPTQEEILAELKKIRK